MDDAPARTERKASQASEEVNTMSNTPFKSYRWRLLAILAGLGLWAVAGWAFIAGGTQHTVVCEHAGPETITCRERNSLLGQFPIGRENIITPIHAAEQERSCYTESAPRTKYVCKDDTVRVFTPDTSHVLFQRLPEDDAQARAIRINHFIHRETAEERLVFAENDGFQFWVLLFLVTLPMFICGGLAFWLVLSRKI